MLNIFICFLVLLSTFVAFNVSLDLGYINRTFSSLGLPIVEQAIEMYTIETVTAPYYNRQKFKNITEEYYKTKLEGRVKSFELKYYFYDVETASTCTLTHCSGIKISMIAQTNFATNFERSLRLEIN